MTSAVTGATSTTNTVFTCASLTIMQRISELLTRPQRNSLDRQAIIDEALQLLGESMDNLNVDQPDLEVATGEYCLLLQLNISEIEYSALGFLNGLLDEPQTLLAHFENNWCMSLTTLEKQVSALINQNLREKNSEKVMFLVHLYLSVLERLLLISLIHKAGEKQALIKNHLQSIDSSCAPWLSLLEKEGEQDELVARKADAVKDILKYIRTTPTTPEFQESLDGIKKCLKSSVWKLGAYLGNFCAEIGYWDHVEIYHQSLLNLINQDTDELKKRKFAVVRWILTPYFLHGKFSTGLILLNKMKYLDPEFEYDPSVANLCNFSGLAYSGLSYVDSGPRDKRKHNELESWIANTRIHKTLGSHSRAKERSDVVLKLAMKSLLSKEVDYFSVCAAIQDSFFEDCAHGDAASAKKALDIYNSIYQSKCGPDSSYKGDQTMLAYLYLTERRLDEAIVLFEQLHAKSSVGSLNEAITLFDKMHPNIQVAAEVKAKISKAVDGTVVFGLSQAYVQKKQFKRAIDLLNNSLPLWRAREEYLELSQALLFLGFLHVIIESIEIAEEKFKRCISVYKIRQADIEKSKEFSITFLEERSIPYIGLESLLLQRERVAEALVCSDSRRAAVLVSNIGSRLNQRTIKPLRVEEILTLARKYNTVFISYSFNIDLSSYNNNEEGQKCLFVWVVNPSRPIEAVRLDYEGLPEELKTPSLLFDTFPYKKVEAVRGPKSVLTQFHERLSKWYDCLIRPIEQLLPQDGDQTITVVPDGVLAHIPFGAFKDGDGFLIQKHAISMIPSLQVMQLLDQSPQTTSQASVLIGNPTTPVPKLNKLSLAEKEVQTCVAPYLKTQPDQVIIGAEATVSRVFKEMPEVRWIHLACHGFAQETETDKLDKHSVFEGHFTLARDESHPNGFMHAEQISTLALKAELVFMSACESGRGRLQREGSVGHIWSFLAAGAQSTVATYWNLPENQTTLDMVDLFYRHLMGIGVDKMSKARALQQTIKVAIEKNPRNVHQWGAFFFSGIDKLNNE